MLKAYKYRIYPNMEQRVQIAKTFGCCRFLYNQMLNDKIREYKKTKKLLKNTPAMYKKEYPFLKEVDSLALANVQLHLEKAYKNFFLSTLHIPAAILTAKAGVNGIDISRAKLVKFMFSITFITFNKV